MNKVEDFLKEIYRVLKPGGKLGLSTTNFDELAKLWTLNITGSRFQTKQDWERYSTLSQIIYGNQAGEGEYHKVAFNPVIMAYWLQMSGFKAENIIMEIFPTNSKSFPPQEAYKAIGVDLSNSVILTEIMWVEAIK